MWTLPQASREFGIGSETFSKHEKGRCRFPRVEMVRRLRELEERHAQELHWWDAGYHPIFYLPEPPSRPRDLQQVAGMESNCAVKEAWRYSDIAKFSARVLDDSGSSPRNPAP